MTTKEKGNLGLTKVIVRFVELGYAVFTEIGDNSDIDLIAIKDGKLLKLQVKTTEKINNGKMQWTLVKTRLNSKGYRKNFYDTNIDAFALCCLENNYIGLIPFADIDNKYAITLRLEKAKNNQSQNIRFAKEYSL